MKLTKKEVDDMARKFRSELNKAASSGIQHTSIFAFSNKKVVAFKVAVGKHDDEQLKVF